MHAGEGQGQAVHAGKGRGQAVQARREQRIGGGRGRWQITFGSINPFSGLMDGVRGRGSGRGRVRGRGSGRGGSPLIGLCFHLPVVGLGIKNDPNQVLCYPLLQLLAYIRKNNI